MAGTIDSAVQWWFIARKEDDSSVPKLAILFVVGVALLALVRQLHTDVLPFWQSVVLLSTPLLLHALIGGLLFGKGALIPR
jgi:hypothetical protein